MWREVERDLEGAQPGSAEADRLQGHAKRLRDAYQDILQEAIEHDRPAPPAFPEPDPAA
jgi:hypothetical protein